LRAVLVQDFPETEITVDQEGSELRVFLEQSVEIFL
jgi:hypothetical protein